jgi:hypothetical protein
VVQQTTVQAQDKPVNRIDLKEGATVEDLVQELQRTGAGARDVISILQAMKEAGALWRPTWKCLPIGLLKSSHTPVTSSETGR